MFQDEVYRIAREVLRNAFRHARARHIEAEIRYDARLLRLRIRDDGKGIDSESWRRVGARTLGGLLGIRERAKRIGRDWISGAKPERAQKLKLNCFFPLGCLHNTP